MKRYNPKDKKDRKQIRKNKNKIKEERELKAKSRAKDQDKKVQLINKSNILKIKRDDTKDIQMEKNNKNLFSKNNEKENSFKDLDFYITVEYNKKISDIYSDMVIWDTSNTFFPDAFLEMDFFEYYGIDEYQKVKENKSFLREDEAFIVSTDKHSGKYIAFISTPDLNGKKWPSYEDKNILRNIYKNIFKLVKEKDIKKIVIPNIRMRQNLWDIETALDIFINEVMKFVKENKNILNEVIILTKHDDEYLYIKKYMKGSYYNTYNFLKKDVLNISKDSVKWQDRKRDNNGLYPVYGREITNIFDKLHKYNSFRPEDEKIISLQNKDINIYKYIKSELDKLDEVNSKNTLHIKTKDILKYLEDINKREKNHDGVISGEILDGTFKKALQILIMRGR